MKKIILLFIFVLWLTFSYADNYSMYVDKSSILILDENYKSKLDNVSNLLQKYYPEEKKHLDSIIFQVVWVIDKNYSSKKKKVYKKLADYIVSYIYNHNIQKWTKKYYELAYVAYTFYDFFKYYEKKDKFIEIILNN